MYATTLIIPMPEHLPPNSDSNSLACLDISCGVIFVDCDWLLKHLSHQKISTISTFLKVRGISASKYESAEFAALLLYFPGKNDVG